MQPRSFIICCALSVLCFAPVWVCYPCVGVCADLGGDEQRKPNDLRLCGKTREEQTMNLSVAAAKTHTLREKPVSLRCLQSIVLSRKRRHLLWTVTLRRSSCNPTSLCLLCSVETSKSKRRNGEKKKTQLINYDYLHFFALLCPTCVLLLGRWVSNFNRQFTSPCFSVGSEGRYRCSQLSSRWWLSCSFTPPLQLVLRTHTDFQSVY